MNIINAFKDKNIIDDEYSLKNEALQTLLDFDMPCDLKSIYSSNLFYCSTDDIQILTEIRNKEIVGMEIIKDNSKYVIVDDSDNENIGIRVENNDLKPMFITHFCSLKNSNATKYYDYVDLICDGSNIFDLNKKEKSVIKVLTK